MYNLSLLGNLKAYNTHLTHLRKRIQQTGERRLGADAFGIPDYFRKWVSEETSQHTFLFPNKKSISSGTAEYTLTAKILDFLPLSTAAMLRRTQLSVKIVTVNNKRLGSCHIAGGGWGGVRRTWEGQTGGKRGPHYLEIVSWKRNIQNVTNTWNWMQKNGRKN